VSCVNAFVGPKIAGALLTDDPKNINNWMYLWIITASIMGFAGVFYAIFADGNQQPWSKQNSVESEKRKEKDPVGLELSTKY